MGCSVSSEAQTTGTTPFSFAKGALFLPSRPLATKLSLTKGVASTRAVAEFAAHWGNPRARPSAACAADPGRGIGARNKYARRLVRMWVFTRCVITMYRERAHCVRGTAVCTGQNPHTLDPLVIFLGLGQTNRPDFIMFVRTCIRGAQRGASGSHTSKRPPTSV